MSVCLHKHPLVRKPGRYICKCGREFELTRDPGIPPSVRRMLADPNAPTPPLREFLSAYREDDNIWWMISCGHHQNLFEDAVEMLRIP